MGRLHAILVALVICFGQAENPWSVISNPDAPKPARSLPSAVLHKSGMWIFGGMQANREKSKFNDLYCLDLVATKWIQGSPGQRPTARFGHSAIVDQNARMWIYGGHSGQELVKDMFYLGLDDIDIAKGHWSAWTKVTASSSPADRAMHTAVLYQNRMWIFGGIAGDGSAKDAPVFNDVHSLDLEAKAWKEEKCEGSAPSPRWGHSADVTADGRMWIYGGQTQVDQSVGDLSYLDLTKLTWVSVKTGAGTSVAFHTTALDAAGRLWTSGGVGLSGGATWKSKVYYFDTLKESAAWTYVDQFRWDPMDDSSPPLARFSSRSVMEPNGKWWIACGLPSTMSIETSELFWLDTNSPVPSTATTSTATTSTSKAPGGSADDGGGSGGSGGSGGTGGFVTVIVVLLVVACVAAGGVLFYLHRQRNIRLLQQVHEPQQVEIGEITRA